MRDALIISSLLFFNKYDMNANSFMVFFLILDQIS